MESEKLKTKYDEPVIGKRAQSFPPKYTTFARINRVDVAEACQVMGHLTDPVVVVDPGQKKRQDVLAKTPYNVSMRTPGKLCILYGVTLFQ